MLPYPLDGAYSRLPLPKNPLRLGLATGLVGPFLKQF